MAPSIRSKFELEFQTPGHPPVGEPALVTFFDGLPLAQDHQQQRQRKMTSQRRGSLSPICCLRLALKNIERMSYHAHNNNHIGRGSAKVE